MKAYDAGDLPLTHRQKIKLDDSPELEPAFRGQRIDRAVKSAVKQDEALRGELWVSRSGEFGPDFHDVMSNTWWDITTTGQWKAHVSRYSVPFGDGIGLFTN